MRCPILSFVCGPDCVRGLLHCDCTWLEIDERVLTIVLIVEFLILSVNVSIETPVGLTVLLIPSVGEIETHTSLDVGIDRRVITSLTDGNVSERIVNSIDLPISHNVT